MPEIARFFGIVIRMYYLDHAPPHLHAAYGGDEARIRIDPAVLIGGSIPPRVLALVVQWISVHQAELLENWRRLREGAAPMNVTPLE